MIRTLLCTVLLIVCGAQTIAQQPQQRGYIVDGWQHVFNCGCQVCTQVRSQEAARTRLVQSTTTKVEVKTEVAAPKDPPPAPKDPASKQVKADTDEAPKNLFKNNVTKADIVKSIKDNHNLDAKTKAQILASLQDENEPIPPVVPVIFKLDEPKRPDLNIDLTLKKSDPVSPVEKTIPKVSSNFNLLDALSKNDSKPGVKADTDDAQPQSPFLPINPAPKDHQTETAVPKADRKESFLLIPIGQEAATDNTYEVPNTDIGVTVGSKVDYSTSWDINKAVPTGKLLQFWVKPIAKRPDKLKSVAYNWLILPRDDYLLWPDTTRVVLSSGVKNSSCVAILTASYVYLDGEHIVQKTAQAIAMIQVGDGGAVTPTDPGLTGVAKQSYEWTSAVIRASDYTDAKVKADAKKLATVFLDIAERIKKGELADANAIIAATKTANDAAIENRNEWLPWFTRMSDLLRRGYGDNSIRTPAQFEATWREIARGLNTAGS